MYPYMFMKLMQTLRSCHEIIPFMAAPFAKNMPGVSLAAYPYAPQMRQCDPYRFVLFLFQYNPVFYRFFFNDPAGHNLNAFHIFLMPDFFNH